MYRVPFLRGCLRQEWEMAYNEAIASEEKLSERKLTTW